ncbi:hypothetical protein [Aestuariibaculum lutulentum]|uniref:DUF4760 domain-containing protein n=1 Tax=Aestuariibaculum lutulentum TaxID=2920935 RepID=A0ABS9RII7_9FLAO|nr:hypothetical protein [Aestuariibaculum lutulentum]MCH4552766.1 hypothetical protein [Aestuariibaculum lutulentum]
MSWATKQQKGEMALMGVEMLTGMFKDFAEDSKSRRNQVLSDNVITVEEYEALYKEMEEYRNQIENLLLDTELGCKYIKTQEIFLMIVKIIMYDLEFDYQEILSNFSSFIDNEMFIEGHQRAIEQRDNRLDKEYQLALKDYETELKEYAIKIEEKKSKNFFGRLFSEEIPKPIKPERRQ